MDDLDGPWSKTERSQRLKVDGRVLIKTGQESSNRRYAKVDGLKQKLDVLTKRPYTISVPFLKNGEFINNSVPFLKYSVPFVKDSVPFVKNSVPFIKDSVPFVKTRCQKFYIELGAKFSTK